MTTRHFSIPTMLRMTPNALLREFFQRMQHGNLPVRWGELHEREPFEIKMALAELSLNRRAAIENVLHQVFDLSCPSGIEALREVAGDEVWMEFRLGLSHGNFYRQAMRAWLYDPTLFDRALVLHQVDQLVRWRRKKGLPCIAPNTSGDTLQQMSAAISTMLKREQGRGEHCTVEHMHRADGTDYFLAYTDDFLDTVLVHEETGTLASQDIRPTFEIVFAYDRQRGVLETFAKVPSRLKPQLERIFCDLILGSKIPEMATRSPYDLNVLKEGLSRLVTDPEDAVAARVLRLRLAVRNSRRNIILEADRSGPREDIYLMLEECIDQRRLPMSAVNVTAAQFCLDFQPVNGRRAERLTFDVTYPDLCTLRNQRPDYVALAEKYLRKWRIAVA